MRTYVLPASNYREVDAEPKYYYIHILVVLVVGLRKISKEGYVIKQKGKSTNKLIPKARNGNGWFVFTCETNSGFIHDCQCKAS